MSAKSKEKVASIFRKLFRSSPKDEGGNNNGGPANAKAGNSSNASPARRLLNRHRDVVSPAVVPPGSPAFAAPASIPKPPSSSNSRKGLGEEQPPVNKTVRSRRLMKEFKDLQRMQNAKTDPIFTVDLVDDNLYEWHVRLHKLDPESELGNDMSELAVSFILLHLVFPENFPFAPPFMRVITPRIEKGFVMEGGAICMELLTPRGWASAYTVEAIIMQFAASVVKGQGRIQRKTKGQKVFSKRSAEESFRSLVKTHEKYGWVTPSLADG